MELFKTNLHLFNANTQVTTQQSLSPEMKTFYDKALIELAGPLLIHDQFGQKKPIPKNGGKTIEFRKYSPLAKALTPLTEGVTPDGQSLEVTTITSTVKQYGGYITLSDMLLMTAIDNNQTEAIKLLADQAGRTLDTVTREVLVGGTNVIYSNGKDARAELVGGDSTAANNCYFCPDDVKRAARFLKANNAKKINGDFVAIIHPDTWYDFTNSSEWTAPHQYVDTNGLYNGEVGKWAGVRLVETTEAKIFHAADLASDSRTLKASAAVSASSTTISFDGGTVAAHALKGRSLILHDATNGYQYVECTDNTASAITIKTAITALADNADIYPGEAGADGRDVYATLVIAENAYGVTEVEGGGLQYISKQLGAGDDPLNQRATCGWKAAKTAERLVENYMVRIESASVFESGEN